MKNVKESFFWTSYSDLMTSLFFIMLTLFVLVIVLLHKRMEATEQQLEEIKKVEASTRELDKSDYYAYKKEYKKYVLNVRCFFDELRSDLADLHADTDSLKQAGEDIQHFLNKNASNQYLLIIEGQASRNSIKQTEQNYRLSFQRALTLMKFFQVNNGITFGYGASIVANGLDATIIEYTESATKVLDSTYNISVNCNLYFMIASTLLIAYVGMIVTEKFIIPKLGKYNFSKKKKEVISREPTKKEKKGVLVALLFLLL